MSECEANWLGMLRHAIFEVRGAAAFRAFALNHDLNLSVRSVYPGANDALASWQSRHQALLSRTLFSLLLMTSQAVRVFDEELFWSHSGMASAGLGSRYSTGRVAGLGGVRRAQGTRRGRRARTLCATRCTPNRFPGSGLRCVVHTARPGRSSC